MKSSFRDIDVDKYDVDEMKNKIKNIISSKKESSVKEGFESNDGIAHFHEEDWTGIDNVNDGGDGETQDLRQLLVDFINYIYSFVSFIENKIAYEITKLLSRGDFKEEDVEIIKKYVSWFFSICATCFIVYNWYYIMFYKNSISQKPNIPEISRSKFKEYSKENMYLKIFEPYLTFSLFFPEYLQKIFTNIIPAKIEEYLNPTFQFIALFYIIIFILYNFLNSFKQLFIDIIMLNTNNWTVSLMYISVIVLFLVFFAYDIMWSVEAKVPFLNIFYFIKMLVYFLIIIFISPFLGGMMCMFLIIFCSLFIILFYTDSYIDTYKQIKEYITNTFNNKKETFTKELNFTEKIQNFINSLSNYIYNFVFQSAFLFMIIWSFYDYTHNIKSDTLKTSLLIINCLFLFCIPILTFVSYINRKNDIQNKTFQEVHNIIQETFDSTTKKQ